MSRVCKTQPENQPIIDSSREPAYRRPEINYSIVPRGRDDVTGYRWQRGRLYKAIRCNAYGSRRTSDIFLVICHLTLNQTSSMEDVRLSWHPTSIHRRSLRIGRTISLPPNRRPGIGQKMEPLSGRTGWPSDNRQTERSAHIVSEILSRSIQS